MHYDTVSRYIFLRVQREHSATILYSSNSQQFVCSCGLEDELGLWTVALNPLSAKYYIKPSLSTFLLLPHKNIYNIQTW